MKKMILLISVMIVAGGSAHGDDGRLGKILDWDPERELICYDGDVFNPLIEADSERLFIIYDVLASTENIHEIHSEDGGVTWSDPFDVFERGAWGKAMSLEGGNLHVIALAMEGPSGGLMYRRTTNAGYSWSDIQMLASEAVLPRNTICTKNDKVLCTYNNIDGDIMLLRSFDNGLSWEQPLRIVEDAYLSQPPHMVNSNGIWHLVFCSGCTNPPYSYEIFIISSYDDGDTWSGPLLISVHDRYDSQFPNCAADDNGNIAVTWYDYKYGAYQGMWGEILCRISTDYGVNWGPEIRITDDTCSRTSDVYIKDESIYITYDYSHIGVDNVEIYLRQSSNSGADWGEIERVSDRMGESCAPSISYSRPSPTSEMIHIVWYEDVRHDDDCIYYRRKTQQITGIEDNNQYPSPSQTDILYNYPNPFNATTAIKYRLTENSAVLLSIYNLLGEKVTDLVDQKQQAGEHEITWDASLAGQAALSSGIYFYKLTTGEKVFTNRMVLLK
jgi:hypothetical protein